MMRIGQISDRATAQPAGLRFFHGLDESARQDIIAAARHITRKRGERLFRQGASAQYFFVLQSGRVKMTQLTLDGELVLVRLVVPGEAFGGIAALGNRIYPVSAEAADECVALAWNGSTMERLLRKHAQLAVNLLDLLAERLHEMQSRYEELATEQVEQRLARTILRLGERAGRRVEEGTLVDVRLSRSDLAEMTGTTLFSVSRILNRWQDAALIQLQRQRILIREPAGLNAIAGSIARRRD